MDTWKRVMENLVRPNTDEDNYNYLMGVNNALFGLHSGYTGGADYMPNCKWYQQGYKDTIEMVSGMTVKKLKKLKRGNKK
ncbi:hypothetical protein [Anaeromassilibacillus senegalensis]|uniref:hypothetical protein n=1 Tax=Anaeromassilibacillus senegalensis TaxID=1673717 RepID=UPI000681D244|nr:hypothetical protein [Anaeromassilibacillus senegalensis]